MAETQTPTLKDKPRPTLPQRLEWLGLVAAAWILDRLGVDRASALMGFLWRHIAPLNPRHRRADGHLAAAMPMLSAAERRAILGDMWENLGRTAAETLILPRLLADRSRFELDVPALAPHLSDLTGGSVFASLHLGNWEFCGWGIHLVGLPVAAVYMPLKNPLAEDFLRSRREPAYSQGIYPRDAATALKLRTLARKGVAIGMLADLRDKTGIVAPFFGRPAQMATFPAVLARRLGLPLVVGRVVRTKGAYFRVTAEIVPYPVTADMEGDIREATLSLHAIFERWIAETPSQWMWAHKKWAYGAKTAPLAAPEDAVDETG